MFYAYSRFYWYLIITCLKWFKSALLANNNTGQVTGGCHTFESVGGNLVSPSFPSDKFVYLDSPIRITIMGSHQVGKSALAVRYLSRQESSRRSSTASRAFSSTMHGKKKVNNLTLFAVLEFSPKFSNFARLRSWPCWRNLILFLR